MESSRESASAIIGTRYLGTSAANRALRGIEISNFRSGDVFLLLKPEGKLASLLAVTVTPQRDTNIRLPVGGPFFWGSFSLFLVLPFFVLVGSVGIVSCI